MDVSKQGPGDAVPYDLLPFIPSSVRRVLDCACGDGRLGRAIKQRCAAEVAGIESDPVLAKSAEQALDRVLCGELGSLLRPFPEEYFDCVICDDILARLREPEPCLTGIWRVLSPGGLLVATLPNLQYHQTVLMLAEGRWDYQESGIMAWDHLRFYTGREIARMLREAGFEVLKRGALVADPPSVLPRGADGMITMGRVSIGPLTDDEYKAYLTKQYIAFASKPSPAE